MADQRRRGGRGRSGRGGRIPRKGEGQGSATARSEAFVSFPLEVKGPIEVTSPIDPQAVLGLIRSTLDQEHSLFQGLGGAQQAAADTTLAEVQEQVGAHRSSLEKLARDLDPEGDWSPRESGPVAGSIAELVASQRVSRLNWIALLRTAYATGDKRIDQVVKPVLGAKDRHTEVLEQYAVRSLSSRVFSEDEL